MLFITDIIKFFDDGTNLKLSNFKSLTIKNIIDILLILKNKLENKLKKEKEIIEKDDIQISLSSLYFIIKQRNEQNGLNNKFNIYHRYKKYDENNYTELIN